MRVASFLAGLVGGVFLNPFLILFLWSQVFHFYRLGRFTSGAWFLLYEGMVRHLFFFFFHCPTTPRYTLVYWYHYSFNIKHLPLGGVLGVLGRARPLPHCGSWTHAFHICLAVLWLVVLGQL